MLWTKLKPTWNVVSQMDQLGLVTYPALAVFLQLDLVHDRVVVKLKCLHLYNLYSGSFILIDCKLIDYRVIIDLLTGKLIDKLTRSIMYIV